MAMTGSESPLHFPLHYRMKQRLKEMTCPGKAFKNISLRQSRKRKFSFYENPPDIPIPTILSFTFLLLGKCPLLLPLTNFNVCVGGGGKFTKNEDFYR